ncbi:hypothetical protein DSO57_1038873 [Entomophthora muscae]|uniref:Uncharacterized protein n=1 Tax=Entomophthora muscae TaxID=34485 RepID=A0ACC2SMV1_9FUNG|nr:hypothetical protein DSO57_1038873 [Entomophthora muscae]
MQFSPILLFVFAAIQAKDIVPAKKALAGCKTLIKNVAYNCGNSTDILEITKVTLTPLQPRRGEKVEIRVQGRLRELVTYGSTVRVNAKLGPIQVRRSKDICELALKEKTSVKCPIKSSKFDFKHSTSIPIFVPKGHYEIEAIGTSQAKKQIFNVKVDLGLK